MDTDKGDTQPILDRQDENAMPVLDKIIKIASSGADTVTEAFKNTASDVKNHGAFGAMKLVASDVKELLLEGVQSVSTITAPLNPWATDEKADDSEASSENTKPSESKFSPMVKTVLADVEKSISSLGGWLSNNLGINRTASPDPAPCTAPTTAPDAVE